MRPRAERIGVVVNDGTLWSEQPADLQLLFALDRTKALAACGEKGLLELMMATHAGIPPEQVIASSVRTNCEVRSAEPTPARGWC